MHEGLSSLSEREKDALRLLLTGHDAKSIARALNLSVHTVNERLRDARRKLGVSSSREAARLLAAADPGGPNFLADKDLRVGSPAADVRRGAPSERRRAGASFAWLGGGMLIMSLIIAAAALLGALHEGGDARTPAASAPAALAPAPGDAASTKAASSWLALVDAAHWPESWDAAGTIFRTQVSKPQWAATIQPVRQPLGSVSSRVLQTVTRTTSLPNLPAGDYTVIQWQTSFANRPGSTETVILAHESAGPKVIGYFIR